MKNKIQKLAIQYLRYKDQLNQIPQDELNKFRFEIETAFRLIPFKVEFVDSDPYNDLNEMTTDILLNKRMKISTLFNNSALLPNELNLKFRAVHDFLHYTLQQPFNFEGEYIVYKAQKAYHSTYIGKRMLRSEVVLQAAYCTYFGKFPDVQKVII